MPSVEEQDKFIKCSGKKFLPTWCKVFFILLNAFFQENKAPVMPKNALYIHILESWTKLFILKYPICNHLL